MRLTKSFMTNSLSSPDGFSDHAGKPRRGDGVLEQAIPMIAIAAAVEIQRVDDFACEFHTAQVTCGNHTAVADGEHVRIVLLTPGVARHFATDLTNPIAGVSAMIDQAGTRHGQHALIDGCHWCA